MRLDRESLISTDMMMKTTRRNKAAKSTKIVAGVYFPPDGSAKTREPHKCDSRLHRIIGEPKYGNITAQYLYLKEAAVDSTNLGDEPSDSGTDDFIDSEAKPDYVLDPGSWSPIFEPAIAPHDHLEHEALYYSVVSKIVKAYSRGDERAMEEAASEIEAALGWPPTRSLFLGFLYGMGIGRERSKAKSFLYHHFAAEGGNMQSKMALAYTYSRQEQ
ncbi:hypothetical protein HAX54_018075 [Datura stramonium]|uniref:Uncharacterized protein n=1 Tax=Datura stramonium TaxID=4076 RepID=A0ABS8S1S1_DATST|nr:hypothetical protein [Datura stramonium]